MLYNVQALRAFAAIMVVHAHAASATGLRLAWYGGANGVDLFFVISGFIIAYVADLDDRQFMTRRLIRIVPIYWVSTLAIFLLVVAFPHVFKTTSSSPGLLARSLLFVPDPAMAHSEDGLPHPTLAGGWTLNYEMYFYVMFWIGLAIAKRWAGVIAIAILGSVIAIVHLTDVDATSPVAHFYGYPIVIEFMFGLVAFQIVRVVSRHPPSEAWKPVLRPVLVIGVAAGLICLSFSAEIFGPGPRWFQSGLPSFVVVVCAVLLERVYDAKVANRAVVQVGDASYVLYLIHAYVVFGVIRLVVGHRTFSEPAGQLATLALMAISALAAVAVYRYFEQPMLKRLKALLLRPRVTRDQAPPASAR